MNELTIQLMTISIVLFVFFVCTTCMAVMNWNIVGRRNRLVSDLRKRIYEVNKEKDDIFEHCKRSEELTLAYENKYFMVADLNDDLKNEITGLKTLIACRAEELEKPQVVKSKLSKAELEKMTTAINKLILLVRSMPMTTDIETELFEIYDRYIGDLKDVQESLLIWENDEFYLLPIKTMGDLVDTIDTIIKKVDADAPKFTKVLEVARAKIVLALDNKPQNKE